MDENIKTSGIFRINARAQTVEILRESYDRGQKFIVWKENNVVLAKLQQL
jgi:Rho GTPase-activating protein 1